MSSNEAAAETDVMRLVRQAITSVVLDRGTSRATVTRRDGVTATFALMSPVFEPSSGLTRVTYLPADGSIHFMTVRGDEITAEFPTVDNASPLRGRPVVYLDQKDWSLLANSVHEPSKVAPADCDAARTLIELVDDGRLVVPMSAAHMTETCKWSKRDRRYRLALTITQLSRGWQMRHPIAMRRHELGQSLLATLRNADTEPIAAFTLEPGALYLPGMMTESDCFDRLLPPNLGLPLAGLSTVIATFDNMLDAEDVTPGAIPGWVEHQRAFTEWLAGQAVPRRDRLVNAFFLNDAFEEVAEVLAAEGIATEEFIEWLKHYEDGEVANMPSLGLFREVLRGRHLDPATTWESNDFTDMMHLCCAAGYADHVVGERATIGHIEQAAQRLGRTVSVHRRIRELVALLAED